jgi:hypothetical protein
MQEIDINENPAAQPGTSTQPTYAIAGAPLILEFDRLTLRAPTGQQRDVVIMAAELSMWARRIFKAFG